MKNILPALIIVSSITLFSCSQQETSGERLYEPYDQDAYHEQRSVFGIRGAIEHYGNVRGDVETGEVNQRDVYEAYLHIKQNMPAAKSAGLEWLEAGPDNIGGRTRAFAIDNENPNRLYAGAVSGGFWVSTNQGRSWRKTPGDYNLAVNCMEQTSNGTIFFGTGEQNFTRSSGIGDHSPGTIGMGVWRSRDRGESFEHLESTAPPDSPEEVGQSSSSWANVNMIKSDPDNPNRIFAGNDGGLYLSEDEGDTWERITEIDNSFNNGFDIRISPDGQMVFAVMHNTTLNRSQLYRSDERGEPGTFKKVGDGLPLHNSRTVVAIAPSKPEVLYASVARSSSPRLHGLEGVYRSTDNGDNFESIAQGGDDFDPMRNYGLDQGQGDYDKIIAVDPYDHNRIFLGGVHYYGWTEEHGWRQNLAGLFYGDNQNPYYVHADKHEIIFDTTRDPYIKYITTDGGITHSRDAQHEINNPTFATLNRGYATVQFYGVASSYTGDMIGGTQDNGTILVDGTGDKGRSGYFIFSGDGGQSEISTIDPNVFFYMSQHGNLHRSPDRGSTEQKFFDENFRDGQGGNTDDGDCTSQACPFVTPIRLWENLEDSVIYDTLGNPLDTVFVSLGNSRLFMGINHEIYAANDPVNFGVVPEWFRLARIVGFEPYYLQHTDDGNTLYVAGFHRSNSQGQLYRITGIRDGGLEYPEYDPNDPEASGIHTELIFSKPGQFAVGLDVDPHNDDRVVLTFGNYGNEQYVYFSDNAMDSVQNVEFESIHGNLPRIPVYDAIFSSLDPEQIFLATEFGVFATDHINGNNTTWNAENEGMESMPTFMIRRVQDMDLKNYRQTNSFRIVAATHGRGFFVSNTFSEDPYEGPVAIDRTEPEADLFKVNLFPNPAQNYLNVEFELETTDNVTIEVYNLSGRKLDSYVFNNKTPGRQKVELNTSDYPDGIYLLNLSGGSVEGTSKFMINR